MSKVEIILENEKSYSYKPGEVVHGQLAITRPASGDDKSFLYKNLSSIEFSFQGVVINRDLSIPSKILFKSRKLVPWNGEPSLPFDFKIPQQLCNIDNNNNNNNNNNVQCSYDIDMHYEFPPSFGSPALCGESYSPNQSAGLMMYDKNDTAYQIFQDLKYSQVCIVYFISARGIKSSSNSISPTGLAFQRSVEIKIASGRHKILPTNVLQTCLDAALHYGCPNISDNGDLFAIASSDCMPNRLNLAVSSLSVAANLPAPITLNDDYKLHLNINIKPIIYPDRRNALNLKAIIDIELLQYIITSNKCLPPKTSVFEDQQLKKNGYSVHEIGEIRKVTQLLNTFTLAQNQHTAPLIIGQDIDIHSYHQPIELKVPSKMIPRELEPTFHTCTVQNLYILRAAVKVVNASETKQWESLSLRLPVVVVK